jgi:hypothetical protein
MRKGVYFRISQALDVTPRDIFPVFEESQWQEYLVVQ